MFLPSLWVNYILKKYNKILPDMPFTGRELGKIILEEEKITNVSINPIPVSYTHLTLPTIYSV